MVQGLEPLLGGLDIHCFAGHGDFIECAVDLVRRERMDARQERNTMTTDST
jgi:hypothetical protein